MTVGFLKRLLTLFNLAALLLLAGTAWGFLSHRGNMKEEFKAPEFQLPPVFAGVTTVDVSAVSMPLGLYPKPEKPTTVETPKEQPKVDMDVVIRDLGEIKNAFAVYPPYDDGGPLPSILFEFKDGKRRTIGLHEGLIERPNPDPELAKAGFTVPERYQFVGCLPDEENEGWSFFLFRADPTDEDAEPLRARWRGESDEKPLIDNAATPLAEKDYTSEKGIFIGDPDAAIRATAARRATRPETAPVQPTQPTQPVRPPTTVPGALVERDGGAITLTSEGSEYLRDNYEEVLREVAFEPYEDRSTGRTGVLVRRITGSRAAQFGVRPDDVILSINNVPVRDERQAVNVVKRELNKASPPRYIEVRILRNGREITERFDTQDAETRRRARDLR